jgi:hypothetical protein
MVKGKETKLQKEAGTENEPEVTQEVDLQKSIDENLEVMSELLKASSKKDDIKEYISLGLDMAIIEKGGAWYTFGELKAQGEEKLRNALIENPEKLKELKAAVNAHMV